MLKRKLGSGTLAGVGIGPWWENLAVHLVLKKIEKMENGKSLKKVWSPFRISSPLVKTHTPLSGTYNWPVSFVIPPDSPPSIRCDYGSVTYRVRAQAVRAGTFTSKLVANTEVTVISCPSADDLEESESIIVEREWDNNLRYLISLSGKSFPLGGTMPVQLTLMPLSKICIYRLSVVLEEKGMQPLPVYKR